jgi:hypothetical protein
MKMDAAYPGAAKQGYLTVVPIVFSSVSKPQLYSNYIMAHENLTIRLLPDPVTKKEHEDFIMTRTQGNTGYMKYGAPKGRHDDTVTACALAAWGLDKIMNSMLIGGTAEQLMPSARKKPVDPTCQIDTDKIIGELESKQVRYNYTDSDDLNIMSSYTEPEP